MNYSARRINAFAKALGAKTYLEIGVDTGQTFLDVSIPNKTAVDPQFRFDTKASAGGGSSFFELPSDIYFAGLDSETTFDVIFIDGLHVFEQVVRDLSNALLHSHDHTLIILDDTKPNDVYSSLPKVEDTFKFRRLAGDNGTAWHGDVYKTVFLIHDFIPSLNYRTVVGSGNPQTFVWRSKTFRRTARFQNLEDISRVDYFQLMQNIDVLRECDENRATAEALDDLASRASR